MLRYMYIFLLLLNISCAATGKTVMPSCKNPLPVQTVNRTISDQSFDNVVENHINAWKCIHELRVLGSFKK